MWSRVNVRVVWAVGKRDLRRYFSNPTGYVFLTLFILLSAAAAFWRPRFFLNNLANLDQLNQVFPYLLLFFIPALTMGVWSDERRQGTDELLLTLPATELEVVLGKYVATVGMYGAAILLSLSHVLVLVWLGSPDVGLMFSNYLGYWLAGIALIPVGMLASLLTANITVAFILGSLFCAFPISVATVAGTFNQSVGRSLSPLGVFFHFDDFARGVVTLPGLLYFVLVAGLFLYLNALALTRRHWRRRDRYPMWAHHTLRAVALAVALGSITVLAGRTSARLDLTAERLHTLSAETKRLVGALPPDRPVLIQAFVSPEVPERYVQLREDLLSVLREIDAIGAPRVRVIVEDTEPYSAQAQLARERYGINARTISDRYRGETGEVYLGLALTCGPEEQVIPFLERGLSAEYEIARAVRVVSRTSRKRVGIVDTDVKVFGGVDFETNQPRMPWAIVDELRKQYDVVEITPASAIKENVDALLVILPSALTQSELDLVFEPIKAGTPALVVVDPLPAIDIRLAPAAAVAAQLDPYRKTEPSSQRNYGDVRKMLIDLGINWVPARIAWDSYNPHPDMSQLPREAVFVAPGNGNPEAFHRRDPATSGLQEVLMLYPGYLIATDAPGFTFEPLLQTGRLSGSVSYFQVVRPSPAGPVLNAALAHEPDKRQYVLAARVRSTAAAKAKPVNAIVVADLDFISDEFFAIRATGPSNVSFDNISFFLNSIDALAGDDSFIPLRNRRVKHRTLERVEAQTRSFMERRTREDQQAEHDARKAHEEARNRLQKRIQEIEGRSDLDVQAKQIMIRNVQAAENRRLQVLATNIDLEKGAKIQASREKMGSQVRRIQGAIRTIAVLIPPVPVFMLGVAIFVRRRRREREGARALRRLRDLP